MVLQLKGEENKVSLVVLISVKDHFWSRPFQVKCVFVILCPFSFLMIFLFFFKFHAEGKLSCDLLHFLCVHLTTCLETTFQMPAAVLSLLDL